MTSGIDRFLDTAHRGKDPSTLPELPVDAVSGVSQRDAQLLAEALGIRTIRHLSDNALVARATAICGQAIDHDRGPDAAWSALFSRAPLATYQAHPNDFRLDFGPVFYRGRLDGTARVAVVGQDPAANELLAHRIFVGSSGQRVQGLLGRIGITRDYVMVNTFLYPVFGQFLGSLRELTRQPDILGFRNAVLDRVHASNELEAVVCVGAAAADAVDRWAAAHKPTVVHVMHPSARDTPAVLANWNEGLASLRPVVRPEAPGGADTSVYGTEWTEADLAPVPRFDLPFGVPPWTGAGSHGARGRHGDGRTDHKTILWTAP